jgi:hypothetical protein
MGADWYVIHTLYGYAFDASSFPNYRNLVTLLYQLQPFLQTPFQIMGILPEFHSRMEFDETDNVYLDRMATVVIGFVPDADLERTAGLAKELAEYVADNPVLQGFDVLPAPRFFSGIEWYHEEDDGDSSTSSSASSALASASACPSGMSASFSSVWTEEEQSEASTSDEHPSDADDTVNYHDEEEVEAEEDAEDAEEAEAVRT